MHPLTSLTDMIAAYATIVNLTDEAYHKAASVFAVAASAAIITRQNDADRWLAAAVELTQDMLSEQTSANPHNLAA